jgi:hypothetical protein
MGSAIIVAEASNAAAINLTPNRRCRADKIILLSLFQGSRRYARTRPASRQPLSR